MISKGLKDLLTGLDLLNNHAVFFFNKEDKKSFVFPSKETEKKLKIIKPTAYYVFNNQPYILFFDLTEDHNQEREKEIHKQVWSFDQSPLIFIIKDADVEIFNAFAYDKKQSSLEKIDISEQDRNKQFSFWNLQSGEAWKWLQTTYYENKKLKDTQKRVYQRLFDNIKEVRETLITNHLKEEDANILILRIIFIRYLIDRNINIDNNFISGKNNIEKRMSFLELLKTEKQRTNFFKYLNVRFNGVLFKDVSISLSKTNLEFLANIFDVRKDKVTPTLFDKFYFDVFDFSIIPVEVISGIYESLMDKETRVLNSAVYTPAFLVDYILNDTVDKYLIENKTSECKIFDPSCGSGIFLVQSLRRMIDKEIELYNAKIKTKKFSDRIREIAKKNLFGVDKSIESLKVTCFSIYIALLDYQEPKDIDKYEFPNLLHENLFSENFFDTSHAFNEKIKKENIDFILGNPPWKNGSNDPLHKKYLKVNQLLDVVSDYQLAQSFVIRTKDFSNEKTKCCLIITSKAIYNIYAERFRKYFLGNFYLTKCFDLSPVRRLIFEGADNPAMILQFQYANKKDVFKNIVLHHSVKYNIYIKYYKTLVIEKSDTKRIKQQFFYENNWMFKVALYGGILDYTLLKKLFQNYDLKDYINKNGLVSGDGIKRLTKYGKEKLKKAPKPFNDIINIPIIETSSIKEFYSPVDSKNLPKKEDLYVKSGDNIKLYKGERIVLKARPRNEAEIVCSYIDTDCVFREKTLGVSTIDNTRALKLLYGYFISNLYSYYQFITSSSLGIYMPEILQQEYLSFPYKKLDKKNEKLNSLVNQFIGVFKEYYSNEFRSPDLPIPKNILGEINEIIYSAYEIKPFERDIIDYVLKIARYQFQSEEKQKVVTDFTYLNKTHYRNRDLVLKQYASIFLKEFERIYEGEFFQVEVYALNHFIAINFVFLKEKPKDEIRFIPNSEISNEKQVFNLISKSISISKITQDLYIQKDIKGFEENSFYIIKPNEYKCWHRAMAWYDAAEIKEAIQSSELERLQNNFEDGNH